MKRIRKWKGLSIAVDEALLNNIDNKNVFLLYLHENLFGKF